MRNLGHIKHTVYIYILKNILQSSFMSVSSYAIRLPLRQTRCGRLVGQIGVICNQSEGAFFGSFCENSSRVLMGWPRPEVSLRSRGHLKLSATALSLSGVCSHTAKYTSFLTLSWPRLGLQSIFLFLLLINVSPHYFLHLFCPILSLGQGEPKRISKGAQSFTIL